MKSIMAFILTPWVSFAAIIVRISLETRLCAISFLWSTCAKQNSAVTSPFIASVLAVTKAGQEQPLFDDPCDFIARFPVPLVSKLPVLLQ